MSTFDFRHFVVVTGVSAALALLGCSLAPAQCLYMSDCGEGLTCVEGACRPNGAAAPATSDNTPSTPSVSSPDASAARDAAPSASDASIDGADASLDGSDGSADASTSDAASDATTD